MTKKKKMVKKVIVFKKGQKVKFAINTGTVTRGEGVVVKPAPINPGKGQNRLTVKDAVKQLWHPTPGQCKAI